MAKKTSARSKGYRKYVKKPKTLSASDWKKIGIGAAALAIIILLVALLYDDGSLKVKNDKVVVSGENPLVLDVSETSSKHKYYKIGEVRPIEGFSLSEVSHITDENEFLYFFAPDDAEASKINEYYVGTCQGTYSEMPGKTMSTIAAYMTECQMGEAVQTQLGGVDVAYYSYVYARTDPEDAETIIGYSQCLTAYAPSERKNGSILIAATREMDTAEEAVEESVLVDYLTQIVQSVSVGKDSK